MIRIYDLDVDAQKDVTDDLGKEWCTDFSTRFISDGLVDVDLNENIIFKTYGDNNSDITLHLGAKVSTIPHGTYSKIEIM